MSTILSITNSKGGVGKATTALNLAVALSREGKSVLAIDNDPQSNLMASMGYTPGEQKQTLAKLLLAVIDTPEDLELHLPRTSLQTGSGIDLIPSSGRLKDAAARLQVMRMTETVHYQSEAAGKFNGWATMVAEIVEADDPVQSKIVPNVSG